MKLKIFPLLVIAGLIAGPCAAADASKLTAQKTDRERIDSLIQQNQILIETIRSLKLESDRPKTREETFAVCMQAAKGETSPMAAESIGGHCDQILKK